MKIHPNSSVELDEGEKFIEERPDPDNIWRTMTFVLPSGAWVTVQRHYSQIGPLVKDPLGKPITTEVIQDERGAAARPR
jgi:hypothetical protein